MTGGIIHTNQKTSTNKVHAYDDNRGQDLSGYSTFVGLSVAPARVPSIYKADSGDDKHAQVSIAQGSGEL